MFMLCEDLYDVSEITTARDLMYQLNTLYCDLRRNLNLSLKLIARKQKAVWGSVLKP